MIWPASLVSTALLNTLHSMSGGGGSTTGGMSRDRVHTSCFPSLTHCPLISAFISVVLFSRHARHVHLVLGVSFAPYLRAPETIADTIWLRYSAPPTFSLL